MLFPFAYTVPINPPNATLTLTKPEVWQALLRKARRPQDYVPVIESCTIISESATGLVREVTIKPGFFMPAGKALEEVNWMGDMRIDYVVHGPSPRTVHNILSEGAGGALYLTFEFEFERECEAGSSEEGEMWESLRKGATRSVEGVLASIRAKRAEELRLEA
ncbi:MAG: hypothetical protein M1839_004233 [Geoglossum umbratile]|nr:MAG: hypothetical protein M1839_004233 [Geoglossum umbratile]